VLRRVSNTETSANPDEIKFLGNQLQEARNRATTASADKKQALADVDKLEREVKYAKVSVILSRALFLCLSRSCSLVVLPHYCAWIAGKICGPPILCGRLLPNVDCPRVGY
jgi:hypothetical protein